MAAREAFSRIDIAGAAAPSELGSGITATSTSFQIGSGEASSWPTGSSGRFLVAFNRANENGLGVEKVWCTGRSGQTVSCDVADRGADDTSASAWEAGTSVEVVIGAVHIDEANRAVVATVGEVEAAGDLLVGSGANTLARLAKGTDGEVLRMASGALDWGAIPAGSVDTAQLADDAVTGAKIDDDQIDSQHYVDGSIDRVHLAADVIDGTKLADGAVNSEHIAAGAVDLEHMSANSVDSDQYVDGSIDTAHLADGAVTGAKIDVASVLALVYPVGSIYFSTNGTNPASSLGFGTWAAFGAGRVPVGFNSSDGDFDTDEETGGEKTVTLTAAQSGLRQHSHGFGNAEVLVQVASGGDVNFGVAGGTPVTKTTAETTGNTGPEAAASAHNNMPPYVVVRMWKRTA